MFEAAENNKRIQEKYQTEQKIILLDQRKEEYNEKNIKISMARKALCIKGTEDYCVNRKINLSKKSKERMQHTKI